MRAQRVTDSPAWQAGGGQAHQEGWAVEVWKAGHLLQLSGRQAQVARHQRQRHCIVIEQQGILVQTWEAIATVTMPDCKTLAAAGRALTGSALDTWLLCKA